MLLEGHGVRVAHAYVAFTNDLGNRLIPVRRDIRKAAPLLLGQLIAARNKDTKKRKRKKKKKNKKNHYHYHHHHHPLTTKKKRERGGYRFIELRL